MIATARSLSRLAASASLVMMTCHMASAAAPTGPPATTKEQCEAGGGYVWVEGGPFIAGSDRPERDYAYRISAQAAADAPEKVAQEERDLRAQRWFDGEPARHESTLAGFCIARHAVTNAEYLAFVRATGHRVPGITAAEYQSQGFLVHPYAEVEHFLWREGTYPEGESDHPVVLVSAADAAAFASWLGGRDGFATRLPTDEEWEKAARGTDGRYFPWGKAWRADASNWSGSGRNHTTPAGSYAAGRSASGADDMAGNVFEYTATSAADGAVVVKNCAWDDLPGFCRAAYRHSRPAGSRHILIGFRLVRE